MEDCIMKANNKILMRTDTRAHVGIGNLIIFIVIVLISAVAAAVLIQITGVFEPKASTIENETVKEVASNIEITKIFGVRNVANPGNDLDKLEVTILMTGADPIDVGQFVAAMRNKSSHIEHVEYTTDTDTANLMSTQFYVIVLKDEDDSFDASGKTNTMITSGDIITLVFKPGTSMDFPTSEPVRIEINTGFGTSITKEFNTPRSYVTTDIILYP